MDVSFSSTTSDDIGYIRISRGERCKDSTVIQDFVFRYSCYLYLSFVVSWVYVLLCNKLMYIFVEVRHATKTMKLHLVFRYSDIYVFSFLSRVL